MPYRISDDIRSKPYTTVSAPNDGGAGGWYVMQGLFAVANSIEAVAKALQDKPGDVNLKSFR